jgi:hypothetical protein
LHQATEDKVTALENGIDVYTALHNNPFKNLPKNEQLIQGIDYYLENGFYVFKKWHHLKRGYCCKSGCRHCPYGFVKV